MPLFSRIHPSCQGEPPVTGESPGPQSYRPPPQLGGRSSLAPDLDGVCPLQHYAQMAREHLSPLPPPYRWLGPEDLKFIGERQVAAGGFADVYEATHDGRKVVLKSYRPYISFDIAQVIARLHNEVRVCGLLHHGGVDVVPLVGVYSTESHPFGLVYEYMDGLDLGQYVKSKPNVGRLKLLVEIIRCLGHIHSLGIVHGNLQMANILVDKDGTARIAGLGNMSILSHSVARTIPEGRISTDKFSHNHTPGSTWSGMPLDPTDLAHPTTANDIHAFGVMAWEVLTGRPPFSDTMTKIAAMHAMLNGDRPPRRNDHEISDRVWYMIQRCWHSVPSRRMSVREAVDLLGIELTQQA